MLSKFTERRNIGVKAMLLLLATIIIVKIAYSLKLFGNSSDKRRRSQRPSGGSSASSRSEKQRGSASGKSGHSDQRSHRKHSGKSTPTSGKSPRPRSRIPSLPTLCLLIGIHGSGKSTWARQYVEHVHKSHIIISSDTFRSQLTGTVDNYSRESEVEEAMLKEIARTVNLNRSCIVDDCQHNLRPAFRAKVAELVKDAEYNRVARMFPMKPVFATTRIERDLSEGRTRFNPDIALLDELHRAFNDSEAKLREEGWMVES